jgi:hypothetical protein
MSDALLDDGGARDAEEERQRSQKQRQEGRKGRQVASPGFLEEGQIVDVLA